MCVPRAIWKITFFTLKSEMHISNVTVPRLECVVINLEICFTLNCQFLRANEFTYSGFKLHACVYSRHNMATYRWTLYIKYTLFYWSYDASM